ncbi:hypothetical protein ABES02_19020 [Neobacillus pocheonensis]|uniref:hypothetical protein n=1 Tax=Neobacillus pocheonensis TaxID=363869 RepID=UPI003D2AC948
MPEQSKPSRKSNYDIEGNPYLDTSKNHSTQANFTGVSPYLNTSEDPSTQVNTTDGVPYLDTSED